MKWFIQYTTPLGSQVWITCEQSFEILKDFRYRGDEKGLAGIAEQILRDLNINFGGVRLCFLETIEIKPA